MWESQEEQTEFSPDPEAMLDEAIVEAGRWIKEVTYRDLADPKDLQKSLSNGVLLCELVQAIKRGSVKRPNRYASKENLKEFYRACEEELGLDPATQQIFAADDLQSFSRRLSWVPSTTSATKTDREKLKSIITTIYWIAEAATQLSSYSGPKLDVYAFESVIFGIYSPREASKPESGELDENGTDNVFEEDSDFLNLPEKIKYKEPAWKAALKAVEVANEDPPVKPTRGLETESEPPSANKESSGSVGSVGNHDPVVANGDKGLSSDDADKVVLRQPSAVKIRRMERKLGRKQGPPTASKPHSRSLSLPETSNVTMMRQNALDSNHNSATFEDLDDEEDEEDSGMWRSSFNSWKMKRNQVASNVLERKAFREEVDTVEQNKGKKKPKTFREIVEEKQKRENFLAKKFQRKKDLQKDEIHAILTSVDLVDSDDDDYEEEEEVKRQQEPEIQVEIQPEQHTQMEKVKELKEGADYADSVDTSSPSPTATTPSEESYSAQSFHEKVLQERERAKERAEAAKKSQETARKPKPKRMSLGIMGRIAAFNSGDAFKKKAGESDEEEEAPSSSTSSSARTSRAPQDPGAFTEHTISLTRRPRSQGGFGFTVTGGIDKKKPIIVKGIDPGSTAGVSSLKVGDEIIVINKEKTKTFDHDDIQYSISQAVLSGQLTLKVRRYDDDSSSQPQLRSRSTSSSSSSYPEPAHTRLSPARRDEEEEERQREEERRRRDEERREEKRREEEEERQREEEQRRRDEERREEKRREEERKEEQRRREEERRRDEERRREEEEIRREERRRWEEERLREEERRREEEEEDEEDYPPDSSSMNALSKAKQLLDVLTDDDSAEESSRHGYMNGDSKLSLTDSWTESDRGSKKGTRDEDDLTSQEEEQRMEEEIMKKLQEEEKAEDEREEVHRQIIDDEKDKSPSKESLIAPAVQQSEQSAPPPSGFLAKPAGFRSIKGPRSFVSIKKGPEPFRPQVTPATTTTTTRENDVRDRVKKDRSDFFPGEEDTNPSGQNIEALWSKVEHTKQESAPPASKSDADTSNRKSFNVNEERQRLEKWQKEQERIRQEQYEQEQRRLKEEQEKDLQWAESESRRKQEMENRALQERKRVLHKKKQEELRKREEEMLERERKERERRRLEQVEREEEERKRRKEEERQQEEQEERERIEREQREREEAERRREEELQLVKRRKEEDRRAQEMERQRIKEDREARERKAKERIQREQEEYERLLKEREEERRQLDKEREEKERVIKEREERERAIKQREERERAAREREERERDARERKERERAAREQERRIAKEKEERERAAREQERRIAKEKEERKRAAREAEGKERLRRPVASEVIRPQVQEHQESAPPPSRHQQPPPQQPDEDLLQRIREEERELIRQEERDRLRREWEELEREKREQAERQQREKEEIMKLKKEQAELQRERERLAQQQKDEMTRLTKQREVHSKSMNNVYNPDEDVERKNSYNRRKQHGSQEDLKKPMSSSIRHSPGLEKDIIRGKMVPERDSKPGQAFMARHKDDSQPLERHWLVEEAKRRQQGPLMTKSTENLPIQPRKDSLDHEPVLERKVYNQEHAAPPHPPKTNYNIKPNQKDYIKNESHGYEEEVPTRIPPPNHDHGSMPRSKNQQPHPHEQPSPSTSSDTNRWDAPRQKYDTQPEFKHVQRRMHGAPIDPERKQKMHNRRSMPDLDKAKSFAAPVTRIMDDSQLPRGPGASGGPPSRVGVGGGGPPPSQAQQPGVMRGAPPHHPGPGGDQRRPSGTTPDNLIHSILNRAAQKKAEDPRRPSSSLSSHSDSAVSVTSSSEMELRALTCGSEPASCTAKTATAMTLGLSSQKYDSDDGFL